MMKGLGLRTFEGWGLGIAEGSDRLQSRPFFEPNSGLRLPDFSIRELVLWPIIGVPYSAPSDLGWVDPNWLSNCLLGGAWNRKFCTQLLHFLHEICPPYELRRGLKSLLQILSLFQFSLLQILLRRKRRRRILLDNLRRRSLKVALMLLNFLNWL